MARSPLHPVFERLGARFVEFGDWEMPLQFEGVLAEHEVVRRGAGLFDVSHMGRFRVRGSGSTSLLRRLLCNDVEKVPPGKAQYTLALNPAGGVEDDLIVWRLDEEDYFVFPNAANYHKILASFRTDAPGSVETEPLRDSTVLLAVQGPDAPDILHKVLAWKPRRMAVDHIWVEGTTTFAAGTGYTGENGGEFIVPAKYAEEVVFSIIDAGALPCGLGARDTLRLEMGFALWGQDLTPETTPLEAGLAWAVDWDHDFVGRDALVDQKRNGVGRRLVGFVMDGRQVPRTGFSLRAGGYAGEVTSGNFSPALERGIGLGYLAPDPKGVERIEVEVRDRWLPAQVIKPPFHKESDR